jgi:anti-sigma B factor antagonist
VLNVNDPAVVGQFGEQLLEGRRLGKRLSKRHALMLRQGCDRITWLSSDTVTGVQIVVQAHIEGDWTVLTVAGELDVVGAPKLRQSVMDAVKDGRHCLVLDLSGVDFIDSFGIGVIVGALKRVRLLDGDLRVIVPEPRVRRVLEVCDLDRVFTLHRSLADALETI